LEPITDSGSFISRQFDLEAIAAGKTITSLNIDNLNTHRDLSVRGAVIFDPTAVGGGYRPLNPVSTAQDAIISMEGIDMVRSSNAISDIIPGVTVFVQGVSERPVRLDVSTDREAVKEAIITFVGNYNRLMAELNVLTRIDERIIDDIAFDQEEADELRKRLGAFSGDSTLSQYRTNLFRAATSPYPTDAERDLAMLVQIGIGTNVRGSGSGNINSSQMRGDLDIDEKVLDAALERNLHAIRQLFGSDTTGDLIANTGVAVNVENLSRPYTEIGGIIALKTGTIDSRITQDRRRIDTMDRQLAAKETELKIQFGRMESAYARMEQMQSSLDNFSRQNNR
jgi:flagellar hook-associated protein 2